MAAQAILACAVDETPLNLPRTPFPIQQTTHQHHRPPMTCMRGCSTCRPARLHESSGPGACCVLITGPACARDEQNMLRMHAAPGCPAVTPPGRGWRAHQAVARYRTAGTSTCGTCLQNSGSTSAGFERAGLANTTSSEQRSRPSRHAALTSTCTLPSKDTTVLRLRLRAACLACSDAW